MSGAHNRAPRTISTFDLDYVKVKYGSNVREIHRYENASVYGPQGKIVNIDYSHYKVICADKAIDLPKSCKSTGIAEWNDRYNGLQRRGTVSGVVFDRDVGMHVLRQFDNPDLCVYEFFVVQCQKTNPTYSES